VKRRWVVESVVSARTEEPMHSTAACAMFRAAVVVVLLAACGGVTTTSTTDSTGGGGTGGVVIDASAEGGSGGSATGGRDGSTTTDAHDSSITEASVAPGPPFPCGDGTCQGDEWCVWPCGPSLNGCQWFPVQDGGPEGGCGPGFAWMVSSCSMDPPRCSSPPAPTPPKCIAKSPCLEDGGHSCSGTCDMWQGCDPYYLFLQPCSPDYPWAPTSRCGPRGVDCHPNP
jgi:hypothetical protein